MKNLVKGNTYKVVTATSELFVKANTIYVNLQVNDVLNVTDKFCAKVGKKSGKERLSIFALQNGNLIDVDFITMFASNGITFDEAKNNSFKIVAKGSQSFELDGKTVTLPTYKIEKIGSYETPKEVVSEIEKLFK